MCSVTILPGGSDVKDKVEGILGEDRVIGGYIHLGVTVNNPSGQEVDLIREIFSSSGYEVIVKE